MSGDELTKKQRAELETLEAMPEEDINFTDIPEITDWSGFEVGKLFRPVKKSVSMLELEPAEKKSLLDELEAWESSDEILPDVDQGLAELDDVELPEVDLREEAVLTKAVVRTAGFLELPDNILASILDVSPATVDQLKRGDYLLSKDRPEWELGVLLVRIHDALDAIAGPLTKTWIVNENRDFSGKRPIYVMQSPEGLRVVCNYLEAHLNQA